MALRYNLNGIVLRLFVHEAAARAAATLLRHREITLRRVGPGWVYEHDGVWWDDNGPLEAGVIQEGES